MTSLRQSAWRENGDTDLNIECKKRALRLFKEALTILLIGAGYYIFISLTGLSIPCPIKLITGKYCPGCGITRMAVALIHFDLPTAFQSNMLIMLLLPFAIVWGAYKGYKYIKFGTAVQTRAELFCIAAAALASIAFAILRNMDAFAFMRP